MSVWNPPSVAWPSQRCVAVPRSASLLPRVEVLEQREVLASTGLQSLLLPLNDPGDTLIDAYHLGVLTPGLTRSVTGFIGDSPAGAADVDWYSLRVEQPTRLSLQSTGGVLSLYNSDPFNYSDPFNNLGRRLLEQARPVGTGDTTLQRDLAGGTYFICVSGVGNYHFSPLLADSGYPGQMEPYNLYISATGLELPRGPVLLEANPSPNTALLTSPLSLRLNFSAIIDPNTILLNSNVRFIFNPGTVFGDGRDRLIQLADFRFHSETKELQLLLSAPLAPGSYRLCLVGNGQTANHLTFPLSPGRVASLKGIDGTPLGKDRLNVHGQDLILDFSVSGVERGSRANDTLARAHRLGELTVTGGHQISGSIGDDATDPVPFNPADVDFYHFTLSGAGHYAVTAEVFARRLGSSLDPAVTLFRIRSTGEPVLVTSNDNSGNDALAVDFSSAPLSSDAVLYAGLTSGEYCLVVSSGGNVPNPSLGQYAGEDGIFDPQTTHSGTAGNSVGDYVLNVTVTLDQEPPQVLAVSPEANAELQAPPTQIVVRFNESVNLQELAFRAYEATSQDTIRSVWVQDSAGVHYHPRFISYSPWSNEATFQMLQGLPPGNYHLHLSGKLGLTDLAGHPLVGNDAVSGDYMVPFTVTGTGREVDGQGLYLTTKEGGSLTDPQDLGVLFPLELIHGIELTRIFSAPEEIDFIDHFTFDVRENQQYRILPGVGDLSQQVNLSLLDSEGALLETGQQGQSNGLLVALAAGRYVLRIQGQRTDPASSLSYAITFLLSDASENAPPLTLGPAPIIRAHLVGEEVSPWVLPSPMLILPPADVGKNLMNAAARNATLAGSLDFVRLSVMSTPENAMIGLSSGAMLRRSATLSLAPPLQFAVPGSADSLLLGAMTKEAELSIERPVAIPVMQTPEQVTEALSMAKRVEVAPTPHIKLLSSESPSATTELPEVVALEEPANSEFAAVVERIRQSKLPTLTQVTPEPEAEPSEPRRIWARVVVSMGILLCGYLSKSRFRREREEELC